MSEHEEKDPETYELDPPEEDAGAEGEPPQRGPVRRTGPVRSGGDEPWSPILDDEEPAKCPDCGAPMPGGDEVVCLRCGFDLAAMKRLKTETGEIETAEDEEEVEKPPISRPGRGDMHAPALLTGAAILIMTITYLLGAGSLFDEAVGFGSRLGRLLRFYLLVVVFAGAVLPGLVVLGRLHHRAVGDVALAMLRALALSSACSLLMLVVPSLGQPVEFLLEFGGMIVVFLILAGFFFRLDSQEAAIVGGVSIGLFSLFWLVLELIDLS